MVYASGVKAMSLYYESHQIIQKVNAFFGRNAVNRIRIDQKPTFNPKPQKMYQKRAPTTDERNRINSQIQGIEGRSLREALRKLGEQVVVHSKASTVGSMTAKTTRFGDGDPSHFGPT